MLSPFTRLRLITTPAASGPVLLEIDGRDLNSRESGRIPYSVLVTRKATLLLARSHSHLFPPFSGENKGWVSRSMFG